LAGSLALAAPAVATPAVAGPPPTGSPGSPGVGDPFFPFGGNGGYDIRHYHLDLTWQPDSKVLTGSETILATATQALSSFDLDLRGFTVKGVRVNGAPATFTRPAPDNTEPAQELTITPKRALRQHVPFVVQVQYAGTPEVVTDPDDAIEGWVPTSDGAFVVGEPQGSPGWFAANDTPTDKATYDVQLTVPDGLTAVGNGALVSQRSKNGLSTFHWLERYPMASYLATITFGKFDVTRGRTPGGIPTYVAVDPSQKTDAAPALAKLPEIVDYFSGLYGRYPFETVGAIVDDAPDVGYALETQTKPVFDSAPDEATLAHEIAHQWFGDAVTLTQWPDIWLHEGFATLSEWLWSEHTAGQSAHDRFAELLAEPADADQWAFPPANPGAPANLFAGPVYDRGAMTLQALREKIGDDKFFTILRTWYRDHRYRNVTTAQFIALSEKVSGVDLDPFFTTWLYTAGKPTTW
ncbi:MAG TPA: M1 family metallopeptidase, partial [Nakamurella sp.]